MNDLDDLINLAVTHTMRLGSKDPYGAADNLFQFAELVGDIESDGDLRAANETSSAKGLYQFIDGSVEPAVNRVSKRIGKRPWMEEKDVRNLNKEQQMTLFLGDILEKTAVVDGKKVKGLGDELMKGVMEGDVDSMKKAYYILHHTDPDEATMKRVEEKLGRSKIN